MSDLRVKLGTLSVKTSAKGEIYYTGLLGAAVLLGFPSKNKDKFGNDTIDLFVTERKPKITTVDDTAERLRAQR
jgi:hypothetical protein